MAHRNSGDKKKLKHSLFGGERHRRCCFCRIPMTFAQATLEHVKPIAMGGGWSRKNVRLSCSQCNNERGTEDFDMYGVLPCPKCKSRYRCPVKGTIRCDDCGYVEKADQESWEREFGKLPRET